MCPLQVTRSIPAIALCCFQDSYRRQALVEFKSSKDADYAYRKLHGFRMDGRT